MSLTLIHYRGKMFYIVNKSQSIICYAYNIQQQQPNLLPLSEVGYMNQIVP